MSIFERTLGKQNFGKLHPKMRERLSVGLGRGVACVAEGVMSRIWHGHAFTKPFLHLGASRHILFPETGHYVPFSIENWPYVDRAGREAVTFTRTFELPTVRRRFDAVMIFDYDSARLIDYLGTHQEMMVELRLEVDDRGGLIIRSTEQRIRLGRLDRKIPRLVKGDAEVHEWFDENEGRFQIDVRVTNRRFGPLFGYRGMFAARYVDLAMMPTPARPSSRRRKNAGYSAW